VKIQNPSYPQIEIFYSPPDTIQGNQIRLGEAETRHITRVLRHKVGEQVAIVDGEGNEYRCAIARIGRREVLCDIISRTRRAREPLAEVTLAPAIIKGNHLDLVVEMATELGVGQIVPLVTARTVARLTPARLNRFRLLAVAALKSSTRTLMPKVRPVEEFEQFVKDSSYYDLKLIAYEDERHTRLSDLLQSTPRRVALVVGPEGGFTEPEIAFARTHDFRPFTMGPRRLRAETACVTALAMMMHQLKEI
jgi:16S rRNA (uracil1498-N3)-methyltransferase